MANGPIVVIRITRFSPNTAPLLPRPGALVAPPSAGIPFVPLTAVPILISRRRSQPGQCIDDAIHGVTVPLVGQVRQQLERESHQHRMR
jgi:hypothetical protein